MGGKLKKIGRFKRLIATAAVLLAVFIAANLAIPVGLIDATGEFFAGFSATVRASLLKYPRRWGKISQPSEATLPCFANLPLCFIKPTENRYTTVLMDIPTLP